MPDTARPSVQKSLQKIYSLPCALKGPIAPTDRPKTDGFVTQLSLSLDALDVQTILLLDTDQLVKEEVADTQIVVTTAISNVRMTFVKVYGHALFRASLEEGMTFTVHARDVVRMIVAARIQIQEKLKLTEKLCVTDYSTSSH